MIAMRAGITMAALLLAAVPVRPAAACSMMRGYKVPTNLELAATADTIVIAQVDSERKGKDAFGGVVLATPLALLKGSALPPRIEIDGAHLSDSPDMVFRNDPRELRRPNPGALIGGCVRYIFPTDARLLLFLKRDDAGKLVPYRSSFSRDAEDVTGPDALWAKAVREYVAIAALPKPKQRKAMEARVATLNATGDVDDAAIAADLKVELSHRRLPPFD
ncbi:hypothetical protein ASG37_02985 [Sphingomonas sp. Leaf407]|nr:hypothetical protein ASE97_03010 [Sphingomonas sp. Leaf42]KQT30113.1 hypothetical protein ASG37_02985 [Sphingomonas sp. Leaf407]